MKNEELKQEAIKKAYGKHFDVLKNFINDDGEVCKAICPDNTQNLFSNFFWDNLNGQWRPKSLSGIENNNGWTRILEDGSNLPESGNYKLLFESRIIIETENANDFFITGKCVDRCTHYKPIEPEKLPIY